METSNDASTRVRALLETGPYPILTTTSEETIETANPPAHSLFGYLPPRLHESHRNDLIPDLTNSTLNPIHTGQHSNGTTFPLTVHRSTNNHRTYLWLQDLRKPTPPFDVNKPLQAALEHLTPIREQHDAHLTHDILSPSPSHPPQLENILTTILTHAILNVTNDRPRIHITSEEAPHEIRYAIITNLPRRRNPSGQPGLKACRRILKAHGGDLTLQPPDRSSLPARTEPTEIPPGQGAMFLLTLPSITHKTKEQRPTGKRKEDFPLQTEPWREQP